MNHFAQFEQYRDSDASQQVELDFYYAIVRVLKPKVCVEVGTHRGLSGLYVAQALKDNGFGHLHTADPKDYDQQKAFNDQGLGEYATYYRMNGEDMQVENIDYLFIDGFHEKEWVDREIARLFPKLNKGAVVIFHDAAWAGGVVEACAHLTTHPVSTPNGLLMYIHA